MSKRVSVEKFISISTPWGGHVAAKFGIRALKYPVPAWIDMAPGSAFLKALWREPLPPASRHYLIVRLWCAREAGANAGGSPAGAIRRFSTEDRANCVAVRRGGEQAWSRTGRLQ